MSKFMNRLTIIDKDDNLLENDRGTFVKISFSDFKPVMIIHTGTCCELYLNNEGFVWISVYGDDHHVDLEVLKISLKWHQL